MGKRSSGWWGLGACVSLASAAAPPAPLAPGIHPLSDNEVLLCLTAPGKSKVSAVGDFNGWSATANPMQQQGDLFWTTIGGLNPGKEYVFQYWVDNDIHVGDPYAAKVMDFKNDPLIRSEGSYPDLIPYTREQDGPASVFRAGKTEAKAPAPFARPAPENLLIYEVLIRDFVKSHTFKEMKDSLAYFKRLGINALELMPVMEYEGNEGWGYNTIYFMAVDKYYGPAEDLKAFIDAAHAQGIAIILDVVMNHAMGQSPLVRMYWDNGTNAPISNAPYANVTARHPYSVGFDLNYESPYTMAYMKDMLRYWLREFGVDGYRIDLSKGLTQKNTFGDVAAWNRMDPSRVKILDTLAAAAREVTKDAYLILEHFADNDEETLLSSQGFLLWGNEYWDFGGAMAGDVGKSFQWAYAKGGRGWKENHLIAYMESHDEERLMANAAATGAFSGSYDIKDFNTALERYKLAALFYLGVPGPKQMWQYGEYGDDRPRGPTANGQHMGKKPMPDAWRSEAARLRLWGAWSSLLHFRGAHAAAFKDGAFAWKPDGSVRNWKITQGDFSAYAVGNFGVNPDRATLPLSGIWYDFFSREKVSLNGSADLPLKPGEFHLLVNQAEFAPESNLTDFSLPVSLNPAKVTVALRGIGAERHKTIPARMKGPVRLVPDARGLPRDVAGKARNAGAVR